MAKAVTTDLMGWMPKLVSVESVVRDIMALRTITAKASPFQDQIDHHELVRNHIVGIYQNTVDRVVDDFGSQLHLAFRKHKPDNEGGIVALFLILSDDFDAEFAREMKTAAIKAYLYAEPAMGKSDWGDLKDRADEFSKLRAPDLEKSPQVLLERVQASVLRGLQAKEPPNVLARRLNEGLAEAKSIEGERIAETEATITQGTAVDHTLSAAGFTHKRWISVRDDRVRESHHKCDSEGWVPIGHVFSNGLRYPGQADAPLEEIINCRCHLIGKVIVFFLLLLTGLSASASTITGNFKYLLGSPLATNPIVISSPDFPRSVGGVVYFGNPAQTNYLSNGLMNVTIPNSGRYNFYFRGIGSLYTIVPQDTNTYDIAQVTTNLEVFTYTNVLAFISSLVLPGANITIVTNNAGTPNETITLSGSTSFTGDGSSLTNLVTWSNYGLATNIQFAFRGRLDTYTITNGPTIFFTPLGGTNGSVTFQINTNVTIHWPYPMIWPGATSNNTVVGGATVTFTALGGTNFGQLEATFVSNSITGQ